MLLWLFFCFDAYLCIIHKFWKIYSTHFIALLYHSLSTTLSYIVTNYWNFDQKYIDFNQFYSHSTRAFLNRSMYAYRYFLLFFNMEVPWKDFWIKLSLPKVKKNFGCSITQPHPSHSTSIFRPLACASEFNLSVPSSIYFVYFRVTVVFHFIIKSIFRYNSFKHRWTGNISSNKIVKAMCSYKQNKS